jgi:two-component system nitrogen regulation response regulator NtrX
MSDILIVDDEPGIRSALASILEDEKYRVHTAEDAIVGLEILEHEKIDLVFLDVLLPRMGGLEALEKIRTTWPTLEIILISGHANIDMAVRAVKLGAFDFLEKPLSLDKVLTVSRNALTLRALKEENRALKSSVGTQDELIGVGPALKAVRETIEQAAASDARILITGENGTGKELVARAIHRRSHRAPRAFVEVNCAAIPDTLIESELFGHEKGAFTDAVTSRKGRFELASGGTLFLDEIGDMSLTAQSKVLRAIQEQRIERVGGEQSIEVDVRIVAATNKDLEEECRAGRFREDLFFRLNVIPIRIPPLRERKEDIPLLLQHFLAEFGAPQVEIDGEALDFLQTLPWPGNIRELKNLAERIAVMWDRDRLGLEDLRPLLHTPGAPGKLSPGPSQAPADPATSSEALPLEFLRRDYNSAKDLFEKKYLEYQLQQNGYIISRTAEAIGLYPSNLHAKLKKYGIRTER